MQCSRRTFCGFAGQALAAALSIRRAKASGVSQFAIDRLQGSFPSGSLARARAYRADVVVAVMGVPIISRRGAGSAYLWLREIVEKDRRALWLCFSGKSDPARTHGVNYYGSTEEIAVDFGSRLSEAASFGFVTASAQEEGFDQARRRFLSRTGSEHGSLVVVDELHSVSRIQTRKALVSAPEAPSADRIGMVEHVRSQFPDARVTSRDIGLTTPIVPATFLCSVLGAARLPEPKASFHFVSDGNGFQLECEKTRDPHTGAALAAKKLIANADNLMRLSGQIRDLETMRTSSFRLWVENGSDLPVRIDFAPRPYLRISLESDPELDTALHRKEEL